MAVLALVAIGAVIAGVVADSVLFWGAAGFVFVVASTALVAYVARELGVFPEVRRLLRFWRRGS
jgi:hypothetical protein